MASYIPNMNAQGKILSEKEIITMLKENNSLAWGHLYDKYASAMYAIICNLTDDKSLADEIFMKAFLELRQTLQKINYALLPIILRHTHSHATIHLEKISVSTKALNSPKETELIHLFTTQCNTLTEAASILSITVKETKEKLYIEFSNLRKHNNNL